jgi:hypothetical protein
MAESQQESTYLHGTDLSQVLQAVANPQQYPQVHAQAGLKHLWVYIDQVA